MRNWNLDIEDNLVSDEYIEPLLHEEIGPKGIAAYHINPEQLRNIGGVIHSSENDNVEYTGHWEKEIVTGFRGLYKYNQLYAVPEKPAACTYHLPINESGKYLIGLMYYPYEKNASNAKITVQQPKGEEIIEWNFRKGDRRGFAMRVGEYYFEKDMPAIHTISNENANGIIMTNGIGFMKVDN
jgi:hypothetical protein